MKTIKNIKVICLVSLIMVAGSCTKDFDEMNVNPNSATVVPATNVFLKAMQTATYTLFGERLDVYYTGSYAGHTAAIGLGDYEYRVDIDPLLFVFCGLAVIALAWVCVGWQVLRVARTSPINALRCQ